MKILSIGAILMDQIAHVSRFPGEDDEVFVPKMQMLPGGSAANFAVFCSRLGAEVGFIGKVGNDALGQELISDMKTEGVNTDNLVRSELTTGTVFIGLRDDGQRTMFAYSGAANDLKPKDIDLSYLNSFDHLYLANLENMEVLEYAAEKFKGTVSLNPGALIAEKGEGAKSLLSKVDIIICSEREARKLTGKEGKKDYLKALKDMGPELVVVTRGSHSTIASNSEGDYGAKTFSVKPIDTTGAGDAFSAGFIYNYLKTKNIEESLKFGNAVAAITIQAEGARSGLKNKAQVEGLMKQ
jgi:ribokinase